MTLEAGFLFLAVAVIILWLVGVRKEKRYHREELKQDKKGKILPFRKSNES